MADAGDNVDTETFREIERLRQLRIEHRDLDDVINRLQLDLYIDQVQLRRLKRRKLLLKDQISRLEGQLIPDLNRRPGCQSSCRRPARPWSASWNPPISCRSRLSRRW